MYCSLMTNLATDDRRHRVPTINRIWTADATRHQHPCDVYDYWDRFPSCTKVPIAMCNNSPTKFRIPKLMASVTIVETLMTRGWNDQAVRSGLVKAQAVSEGRTF